MLYLGDCLVESEKIESGSVDLILTDLPYGTIKGLGGGSIDHGMKGKTGRDTAIDTDKIMSLANRILRKNGKMILFAQQPFTTELINKAIPNLPFCYSIIWEKDHFANSLIAKKAPVSYYEDILVFSKKHDMEGLHPLREYVEKLKIFTNYSFSFFLKELGNQKFYHFMYSDLKNPQFSLCTEYSYNQMIDVFGIDEMVGFKKYEELEKINSTFNSTFNLWEGKKYKSNILKYKKDYDGYHPTQKPILLLEDLIKTYSNEGYLIVDLTMGSGSTGVACKNTNRKFIGIENNKEYFEIAKQRISQSG